MGQHDGQIQYQFVKPASPQDELLRPVETVDMRGWHGLRRHVRRVRESHGHASVLRATPKVRLLHTCGQAKDTVAA